MKGKAIKQIRINEDDYDFFSNISREIGVTIGFVISILAQAMVESERRCGVV